MIWKNVSHVMKIDNKGIYSRIVTLSGIYNIFGYKFIAHETGDKIMTETSVCPNCKKPFDTAIKTINSPCMHCGFIPSKGGMNARAEDRFYCLVYCQVSEKESNKAAPITATIQDMSKNGAQIRYIGKPLPAGSLVNIHIINLNIIRSAKVVWSDRIKEANVLTGLQFDAPLPLPAGISK